MTRNRTRGRPFRPPKRKEPSLSLSFPSLQVTSTCVLGSSTLSLLLLLLICSHTFFFPSRTCLICTLYRRLYSKVDVTQPGFCPSVTPRETWATLLFSTFISALVLLSHLSCDKPLFFRDTPLRPLLLSRHSNAASIASREYNFSPLPPSCTLHAYRQNLWHLCYP